MDPEGIQRDGEGEGGDGVTSVSAERSSQAAVMFPAALINMQMCRGKKKNPTVTSRVIDAAVYSGDVSAHSCCLHGRERVEVKDEGSLVNKVNR